ncbi:hypothetical protein TL16_g12590 [Triparma laevis f. inornata]|uniref:Uncharacterized protein n=1 Tax=Triparma laevis f. inornata TaxID=1714386 RepID=A0A9W7EWP6_9STRA|nr:hypothetical protein TL16_g12590 [Triparma laevis f. inornata]
MSNPSQIYLLPPKGPLCVFTGFSKDIKSVHESLSDRLKDLAKIFGNQGDVTNTPNPVPSTLLTQASPFAQMSAYECASRISDLTQTDDLNVHGLIVALDPTSPSNAVVMDCTYDGALRDWSKGGATAIGKRGWKVRQALAQTLFLKFDDSNGLARSTFRKVEKLKDLSPTERATKFAVRLIVKSIEAAVDDDEDDDSRGDFVFFVMTEDGVRRLDNDYIKKSIDGLRGGFSPPSTSAPIAKITLITPADSDTPSSFGKTSPQSHPPTILEVASQISKKLFNCEDRIATSISKSTSSDLPSLIQNSDIVVDLSGDNNKIVGDLLQKRKTSASATATFSFSSDSSSPNTFLSTYDPNSPSPLASAPWTATASAKRLFDYTNKLFSRSTTDDVVTALLLNVNAYAATVPWVQHSIDATWEKGPVRNAQEFASMVSNCGDCVVKCLQGEE